VDGILDRRHAGVCVAKADRFAEGAESADAATGELSGVPVNSGRTMEEAAAGIKHTNVGFSTVGEVEDAGGSVVRSPTTTNVGHCLISGCTADTLSRLFSPTVPMNTIG
jgi:hypothetical protein